LDEAYGRRPPDASHGITRSAFSAAHSSRLADRDHTKRSTPDQSEMRLDVSLKRIEAHAQGRSSLTPRERHARYRGKWLGTQRGGLGPSAHRGMAAPWAIPRSGGLDGPGNPAGSLTAHSKEAGT
jgi:hypothetical protein